MLRDIPRIYLMMFGFVMVLAGLIVWYTNFFQRDSDVLQLNETVLTAALSEVDQTSRLYEGALLLADTFETTAWERLEEVYPEGSAVQFDYMFDIEDTRFDNIESTSVSSPTYYIGGESVDVPHPDTADYMTGRPIEHLRIKIREQGDKAGTWTYVSTVTVDAASKTE